MSDPKNSEAWHKVFDRAVNRAESIIADPYSTGPTFWLAFEVVWLAENYGVSVAPSPARGEGGT